MKKIGQNRFLNTSRAFVFSAVALVAGSAWGQNLGGQEFPSPSAKAGVSVSSSDFSTDSYDIQTPQMGFVFDQISIAPEGLGNVDFKGQIVMKDTGAVLDFEAQATLFRNAKGEVVEDKKDNLVSLKYKDSGLHFDVTYHTLAGVVVQTVVTTSEEIGNAIQSNVVTLSDRNKGVYEGDDYDMLAKSGENLQKSFVGKDAPRPYGEHNSVCDFSIAQKAAFYVREIIGAGVQVYGDVLQHSSISAKNKILNEADLAFQVAKYQAMGLPVSLQRHAVVVKYSGGTAHASCHM